jgi:DNA-binding CsgD family transcriptional regulator
LKFWLAHAHHHEARRWLEQILALDTAAPQSVLPAPLRARLLGALGVLANTMNAFEQASRYLNEALQIWREQENSAGVTAALLDLGWMHFQAMDLVGARGYAEQSLALARTAGDPVAVAKAFNLFGIVALEGGALDDVVRAVEEGLSIWRAQGVLPEVANALINLARAEQRRGHLERAGQFMLEAVRLHVTVGDYAGLIGGLVLMVYFEFDAGQPPRERTEMVYEPLGYLASGRLLHEPVTATRLLGMMAGWQEKVVGRNTVHWDTLGVPLCAKLSTEMGEVNFAREFALGQAMGMDDIVALAEEIARAAAALPTEQSILPPPPAPATSPETSPPGRESLSGLTPREIQVLKLVAAGLTNAQIASRLSVTPRTVNAHLTSVYSKTGVTSRTGAVRFALDHGLA